MVWYLGRPVQGQELDLMILMGSFKLGLFYYSVILFTVFSGLFPETDLACITLQKIKVDEIFMKIYCTLFEWWNTSVFLKACKENPFPRTS